MPGDRVKLTPTMRAILDSTPDDLRGVAGGYLHPGPDHRALEVAGLLEINGCSSNGGGFVCRYVRTTAGRRALQGGGEHGDEPVPCDRCDEEHPAGALEDGLCPACVDCDEPATPTTEAAHDR